MENLPNKDKSATNLALEKNSPVVILETTMDRPILRTADGVQLYTLDELASETRYNKEGLRKLLVKGKVVGVKVGQTWLSSIEAVEKYQTQKKGTLGGPRRPYKPNRH